MELECTASKPVEDKKESNRRQKRGEKETKEKAWLMETLNIIL